MTATYVLVVLLLTADKQHSQAVDLAYFKQAQQCYDAQEASQRAYYSYKDVATRLEVLGYYCETR
jgi:hypothetical protein